MRDKVAGRGGIRKHSGKDSWEKKNKHAITNTTLIACVTVGNRIYI